MPITQEQHEKSLHEASLSEQFPVRDYLDNVMVRTSGALVAGYEVRGITSYFASDEERDRSKVMLGALLKSIPEQSMRVQVRYEVVEDLGNLLDVYTAQDRAGAAEKCRIPEIVAILKNAIEKLALIRNHHELVKIPFKWVGRIEVVRRLQHSQPGIF